MERDNEAIYRIQNRNFERSFQKGFAIFLILLGIGITIGFLIISNRPGYGVNNGQQSSDISFSGQLGDFIGGIVGTVFSLAGVILLYITLRAQRENFHRERLESNFFEMIRFNRENLNEMMFAYKAKEYTEEFKEATVEHKYEKRAVLKKIFDQYKEAHEELKDYFNRKKINEIYQDSYYKLLSKNQTIIERDITLFEFARIDIIYLIIFFGVGDDGKETIKSVLKDKYKSDFLDWILSIAALKPKMDSNYWNTWRYNRIANLVFDDIDTFLQLRKEGHWSTKTLHPVSIPGGPTGNIVYDPYYPDNYVKYYGGHQFRLGHYYRHLFQTVRFIDKEELLNFKVKYNYIKILRGQLSTYEQILLFINSISTIGRTWELESRNNPSEEISKNSQLITKYNLIKNIPNDKVMEGLTLSNYYPYVEYETFQDKERLSIKEELKKSYS